MIAARTVLVIGEEPTLMDYNDPAVPSGMTAEKVQAALDAAKADLTALGHRADLCLTDSDAETAARQVADRLAALAYDIIVIGAGVRIVPKHSLLFEAIMNAVHQGAPLARLAFNTKPEDTVDAVNRWA